jgi:hypothetical protein
MPPKLPALRKFLALKFPISDLQFFYDFAINASTDSFAGFVTIREIRVFSLSVFISIHPCLNSFCLRFHCAVLCFQPSLAAKPLDSWCNLPSEISITRAYSTTPTMKGTPSHNPKSAIDNIQPSLIQSGKLLPGTRERLADYKENTHSNAK